MPGFEDPAELLDVDMDQLATPAALITVRWLRWIEFRALAQPDTLQHRRDRRERDP
jgi:hypothetical protein